MGGFQAMGLDHEARVRRAHAAFVEPRNLIGFTLPLVSFSSSNRLTGLLRAEDNFGDRRIEDLWLPWFGVSADLSTGQAVVHRTGEVWRAIRASISLPGVMPPVYEDGHLLVDGGIVNDLPADVMQAQIGSGRIVAVDLESDAEFRSNEAFEPTLSGWRVLGGRLRRSRRSPAPGIVSVLMRTKEVASHRALQEVYASGVIKVHVRPPIDSCPALDFSVGPRLVEIGHHEALRLLDADAVAGLLA
jgi:NTE family protein/lysophospholipid hydrolase